MKNAHVPMGPIFHVQFQESHRILVIRSWISSKLLIYSINSLNTECLLKHLCPRARPHAGRHEEKQLSLFLKRFYLLWVMYTLSGLLVKLMNLKIGQIYFCEKVEKYNNFHFLSTYKDLLLQCIFRSIMWVHFPLHLCYQFQPNL